MPDPVLLVHGTFAYDDAEEGSSWWQRTSPFCRDIWRRVQRHGKAVVAAPAQGTAFPYIAPWWQRLVVWVLSLFRKPSATPVTRAESVFHWSGDNSETARRDSGRLLLAHLEEFNRNRPANHVAMRSEAR